MHKLVFSIASLGRPDKKAAANVCTYHEPHMHTHARTHACCQLKLGWHDRQQGEQIKASKQHALMLLIWFVTLELDAKNPISLTHNMKAATTKPRLFHLNLFKSQFFTLQQPGKLPVSHNNALVHTPWSVHEVWLYVWTCIHMMGS